MTKNLKLRIWILTAASAVLMSVPFLVPHAGPAALVALIPLLHVDRLTYQNGIKGGWLYIFVSFLLFNVGSTFWIWFVSEAGAVAAIILNSLQMAAVFALFRWGRKIIFRRWPDAPAFLPYAILAALWLAWEHVYFNVELSWPWLVLGNSFATSPYLVQWYCVTGALGGTLWILLSNTALYLGFSSVDRKNARLHRGIAGIVILVPLVAAPIMKDAYCGSDGECEVVVVQPNIDPFNKYGVLPQAGLDNRLTELALPLMTGSTRYLITPETFTYGIDIDHPQGNPSLETYAAIFDEYPDAEMLLGALTYRTYTSALRPTRSARPAGQMWYDSFNTAMTTDGRSVNSHYFKSKLVPGVEIIPYQNFLPFLGPLVEKFGGSPNSYGTQEEMDILSMKDGSHKVGAMICYESVYGDYSRVATKKGAQFLAVMTNDGWWGDTPGYRQHFRYAKLRAIENRRYVVHAANTGISGIIDQKGGVVTKTGWWEETAFRGTVDESSVITPFVKYGDVIGTAALWTALAVLAALLTICVSGMRFSRGKSA